MSEVFWLEQDEDRWIPVSSTKATECPPGNCGFSLYPEWWLQLVAFNVLLTLILGQVAEDLTWWHLKNRVKQKKGLGPKSVNVSATVSLWKNSSLLNDLIVRCLRWNILLLRSYLQLLKAQETFTPKQFLQTLTF